MRLTAIAMLAGLAVLAACAPPPPGPPPMTPRPTAGLGQMCGGMMGVACRDPGAFCQTAPQAQCGAADQPGVCTLPPQACTREYRPVCGCDGRSYGNACEAAANSASVAYPGRCVG